MIVVEYDKYIGRIPEKWSEITIEQATKVSQIELPKIDDDFDWYQYPEKVEAFVGILTDINPSIVNPVSLNTIFTIYLSKFVFDLNLATPETYAPQMISSFKHKGEIFLMPNNLSIGKEIVLQHGQNTKSFIEASNLLKQFSRLRSEGMRALPLLIGSVVKQERNEAFSEDEIIRRAELFNDLPMDIAWEVFFCLSLLIAKLKRDTLLSMRLKEKVSLREKMIIRLGHLRLQKAALQEDLKTSLN